MRIKFLQCTVSKQEKHGGKDYIPIYKKSSFCFLRSTRLLEITLVSSGTVSKCGGVCIPITYLHIILRQKGGHVQNISIDSSFPHSVDYSQDFYASVWIRSPSLAAMKNAYIPFQRVTVLPIRDRALPGRILFITWSESLLPNRWLLVLHALWPLNRMSLNSRRNWTTAR